jgi:hypothetical protein
MIQNYLYTIGKYLSPAQRDEVLKEIEANLYDFLEENYGKKDYTDTEIEAALRSMGHPRKVAEAYMSSPRCLIGPEYLDTYWLVLKIALFATGIGIVISNFIGLSGTFAFIEMVPNMIASVIQALLSSFGMVTLIFSIIQHYTPTEEKTTEQEWSLKILESAPPSYNKVSLSEIIAESIFILIALVFLNQTSPVWIYSITEQLTVPVMNPELFKPILIWINLVLLSNIALNLYLLIKRKWQPATRLIAILLDIAGIFVFIKLISTPYLWDFTPVQAYLGDHFDRISDALNLSMSIAFGIVVIIVGFDIYGHIKGLLKK